ncbi:uncharacterized protein Bfra_001781 [Botrytis fragariae]|uniref:Uncharacterized protein n=1 Tax=Botrytis fragariae TaxID=1964551 RepID=A0A8H6B1E4_9HELO|nr:uncharacterized protein Bfra_001781 [Botrytis fragariae]KAF5877414.1 hypothetical protein Bfra_001781 [Botrytis fragariae]
MSLLESISLLILPTTTLSFPLHLSLPTTTTTAIPKIYPSPKTPTTVPRNPLSIPPATVPTPSQRPGKQGCTGYCAIKSTAGYGQEVPITDASCQSARHALDSNGHAEDKVHFVMTDCETNGVLKMGQDPTSEYPGVSTGPKQRE